MAFKVRGQLVTSRLNSTIHIHGSAVCNSERRKIQKYSFLQGHFDIVPLGLEKLGPGHSYAIDLERAEEKNREWPIEGVPAQRYSKANSTLRSTVRAAYVARSETGLGG